MRGKRERVGRSYTIVPDEDVFRWFDLMMVGHFINGVAMNGDYVARFPRGYEEISSRMSSLGSIMSAEDVESAVDYGRVLALEVVGATSYGLWVTTRRKHWNRGREMSNITVTPCFGSYISLMQICRDNNIAERAKQFAGVYER